MKPPPNAELFAAALISDPELRDAVLGDLAEDHRQVARTHSESAANRWYWSQLIRSTIPFSLLAINRGGMRGWMRLVLAVVVGYVAIAASVMVTDAVMTNVVIAAGISWPIIPPWQYLAGSLGGGVICGVFAGYVAAVVGGRSPIAPALGLGVLCAAFSAFLIATGGFGGPLWYQLGILLIVFPATVGGAFVRARQLHAIVR
jgi:hypothetical protein